MTNEIKGVLAKIVLSRDGFFARAAVVLFIFRAGSTFPVPVCTVPHGLWVNEADNQQD